MVDFPRITSLKIDGFKVFENFEAKLGPLEVIVGANGAGKSSLFALLKLILDSQSALIPPEIIPGPVGENVFFQGKRDRFRWVVETTINENISYIYGAEVLGPRGLTKLSQEKARVINNTLNDSNGTSVTNDYDFADSIGVIQAGLNNSDYHRQLKLPLTNQHRYEDLYLLARHIKYWKTYNAFNVNIDKIRRSCVVEQEPVIHDDFGNISALLHYYVTEHPQILAEIDTLLGLVYAGVNVRVKARGGPGEVIGFLQESSSGVEFTLADLSDGILRFLCWAVLCLHPKPPTLICIDEPELGLHPRVLPLLAGLFQKASERTQIILATHSSYFLSQFHLENIAVMCKEDGRAVWKKPSDSATLKEILADFGQDEIERLHISDELEALA